MRYLTGPSKSAQERLIRAGSGSTMVSIIYELLDTSDTLKKRLTNIAGGMVEYTSFTTSKLSGSLSFVGDDPDIDWINDRVRISVQLANGIDTMVFPVGVYLLSSPTVSYASAMISRDVDVYSKLQILIEDKFTSDTVIPSGVTYTTQIMAMIAGSGINTVLIPASTAITQRDLEFRAGTSKIDCINALLKQINYTDLNVDNAGYLVTKPYVPVNEREVTWDYMADSESIIFPEASEQLNLFNVPNVFICVASNAETGALRSEFINNAITDPTSLINRKRRIVQHTTINDVADQATLDAYVQRLADEANNIYGELNFSTAINPIHEWSETLRVQCGNQVRVYEEIGWRIELSASGRMSHTGRWLGNA